MRAGHPGHTLALALLVAALGATPVLAGGTPISTCGDAVVQNDAGSGTDAGASLDTAVPIADDAVQYATLGTPAPRAPDTEDWFSFDVPSGEGARTVMVDLLLEEYAGGPYGAGGLLTVEARTSDGSLFDSASLVSEDGPRIEFVTEDGGRWYFRFVLVSEQAGAGCPVEDVPLGVSTVTASPTYAFYLGCDPHCFATT